MEDKENAKERKAGRMGKRSRYIIPGLALLLVLLLSGSALAEDVHMELEKGTLLGGACIRGVGSVSWVEGLQKEGDGVSVTMEVPESGFYDIVIRSASMDGSHKENHVAVDGERVGEVICEGVSFADNSVEYVYLAQGTHEIAITSYWGWVKLDSVTLRPSIALPEDVWQVAPTLVNPGADENALRLMRYLCSIYGRQMLSGQYCDTGMNGKEMTVIEQVTGRKPAVLGLDMIELSPSRAKYNGGGSRVIEYAKEWWEAGGIVTFCWHWNVPEKYFTDIWWKGFYTDTVSIDLAKIMGGEDPEGYELLMRDIDVIAGYLAELRDAGVPVLWRPLHEASGGWFWWGAAGAEAYKQLYISMYEKLTVEHNLTNLIWVWNGQSPDWYPGDAYVDIIGDDIYAGNRVYTTQAARFLQAVRTPGTRKLVMLTENGCLIDPELAERDHILWGMFCTWQGEFVQQDGKLSEQYNDADMLRKVYGSDLVLTLDELPELRHD